ncbi:hypothetical protein DWY25_02240 [Holdemania filiformis]|uniref:Uncharacterized protein n=1 Tax=Holdemania filiformis TaxID=61171 RepID=A0A412G621_9FIRM|nr:hypothetical protein DWY25_02240 [Holdemania filiformis]
MFEYIESYIYGILGYEVQQTLLGIKNNELVVACKNFTDLNRRCKNIVD